MKAPEVKLIQDIQDKLAEKFPNILDFAVEEFRELHDDVLESPHLSQLFYGWFFNEFCLADGKNIPILCFEILALTDNEKIMLHNIQNAIHGLFEILYTEGKIIFVRDLLTKKEYQVMTIDMDPLPKGTCLEASLVKNLKGEYFFFGGFYLSEKESAQWNLLEYSRDLTLDERTERELGTIQRMEASRDRTMLLSYLDEVFGMPAKNAKVFLRSNKSQRRELLKAIIYTTESTDEKDFEGEKR